MLALLQLSGVSDHVLCACSNRREWARPKPAAEKSPAEGTGAAECDIESRGGGEGAGSSGREKEGVGHLIPSGMPTIRNAPGGPLLWDKSALDQPYVDKNKPPSVRILADGGGSGQMAAWTLDVYNKMQGGGGQQLVGGGTGGGGGGSANGSVVGTAGRREEPPSDRL